MSQNNIFDNVSAHVQPPSPLRPPLASTSTINPIVTDSSIKNTNNPSFSSFSSSSSSSNVEDPLSPGDLVGENLPLQGSPVSLVSESKDDPNPPAREFQVVKRLGTGSYAVVYLVKEVLSRPEKVRGCSEDGHMSLMGSMDMDSPRNSIDIQYGREFAIKCLSKANLDQDALAAQMSEVHIHQSLRPHPNIVTLHRTLESPSFLLLLLEYVPGEDLFYFLEQSRDHASDESPLPTPGSATPSSPTSTESTGNHGRTPPTPSLLSSTQPSQLLSPTRLRLIASMFTQMCGAVAACHKQSVYHRDIKPENFIVTDGWTQVLVGGRMRRERKVVVKLTDFGLSTTDTESGDMDCGSAPYMAYECRNNVSPTYTPRDADVWSLGIVLINMLYHYNPWTDTALLPPSHFQPVTARCPSFETYRKQGAVTFFTSRFMGMTREVAEALGRGVFCILGEPGGPTKRWEAAELGRWAKELPTLLGTGPGSSISRSASLSSPISPLSSVASPLLAFATSPLNHIQHSPHLSHTRGLSISSIGTGHPISSSANEGYASHRPSSRQASAAPGHRTSIIGGASPMISASRSLSRVSSGIGLMRGMSRERKATSGLGLSIEAASAASDEDGAGVHEIHELSTVYDEEVEELQPQDSHHSYFPELNDADFPEDDYGDQDQENDSANHSRSTSTNAGKRRKRGARKGKNASVSSTVLNTLPAEVVPPLPPTPTTANVISSWTLKDKLSFRSLKSPDDTLKTLATASQSLAREISKAKQGSTPSTPSSPHSPLYPAQLVMKQSISTTSSSKRSVQSSKSQQSTGAVSGKSGRGSSLHSAISVHSSVGNPQNLNSQGRRSNGRVPFEPVSMYALPTALMSLPPVPKPLPVLLTSNSTSTQTSPTSPMDKTNGPHQLGVPKKTSKWKLSFGKSGGRVSPVEEVPSPLPPISPQSTSFGLGSRSSADSIPTPMSATASNVTNLLMGLNAPSHQFLNHPPPSPERSRGMSPRTNVAQKSMENLQSSTSPERRMGGSAMVDDRSRSRGRKSSPGRVYAQSLGSSAGAQVAGAVNGPSDRSRTRGRSGYTFAHAPMGGVGGQHSPPLRDGPPHSPGTSMERHQYRNGNHSSHSLHSVYQPPQQRAHSPTASVTYTHRSTPASISSIASSTNNWRTSMMSTSTASSAFTRYSNASARSVSTVATSVSASSWRTGGSAHSKPAPSSPGSPGYDEVPPVPALPPNVKFMTGVPFILGQAKTNAIPAEPNTLDNATNMIPPARKQRSKKQSKDSNKLLDTITESSNNINSSLRELKSDASTSTTDLTNGAKDDGIKKVQKGQITALGKMLSAFKQKSY